MKTVTLYTKPGCLLCAQAERELRALQREIAFELLLCDITQDPQLLAQYQYDIPVVLCEGVELCRHRIDGARVRRALLH
ncbi:MAG: glutaredoxin family protein [Candidatus Bipolaricaulota bacterium]|nr:glutaredoxin family protein [Candidatus Bipolaricaulota bacterium]